MAAARGSSVRPLGVLFVAVLIATAAQVVTAQTCTSIAANILTSTCFSVCSTGQLCTRSSSGCVCYEKPTRWRLSFRIVFNTSTTTKFQAGSSTPSDIISETYKIPDSNLAFNVSNDIISKIDQLELVSTVTTVNIYGGSTASGRVGVKGVVAGVEIDEEFLSGQNQITEILLVSVSLGASINTIANNLPSKLLSLTLDNTLLNEFPSGVRKLEALKYLYVVLAFCGNRFLPKSRPCLRKIWYCV